jgi:hypothetical protein
VVVRDLRNRRGPTAGIVIQCDETGILTRLMPRGLEQKRVALIEIDAVWLQELAGQQVESDDKGEDRKDWNQDAVAAFHRAFPIM